MRMTCTAVMAAGLVVISAQAQALSCLATDAISTFAQLDAAPDDYIVLHGSLTFDENALPPVLQENPVADEPAPITAEFTGTGLTADGFTVDYAGPVVLQITCAGPWCGTAQSGQDAVIFVSVGDSPLTVTAGPCGGRLFYEPTPDTLAALTTCMQDGPCSAE